MNYYQRPNIIYTKETQRQICKILGLSPNDVVELFLYPTELIVSVYEGPGREKTSYHYRVRSEPPRDKEKMAEPSVKPDLDSPQHSAHNPLSDKCKNRDSATMPGQRCPVCEPRYENSNNKVNEDIERLPHSRACGVMPHNHGIVCARDCPTCHGRIVRTI